MGEHPNPCPICGYDLYGLPSATCPECGFDGDYERRRGEVENWHAGIEGSVPVGMPPMAPLLLTSPSVRRLAARRAVRNMALPGAVFLLVVLVLGMFRSQVTYARWWEEPSRPGVRHDPDQIVVSYPALRRDYDAEQAHLPLGPHAGREYRYQIASRRFSWGESCVAIPEIFFEGMYFVVTGCGLIALVQITNRRARKILAVHPAAGDDCPPIVLFAWLGRAFLIGLGLQVVALAWQAAANLRFLPPTESRNAIRASVLGTTLFLILGSIVEWHVSRALLRPRTLRRFGLFAGASVGLLVGYSIIAYTVIVLVMLAI